MDLKVGFCNVNGLARKRPLVESFLHDNEIFIFGMAETHFKENLRYSLSGYKCFRQDRSTQGQPRGGVAIFLRHNINAIRIPLPVAFRNHEAIMLKISVANTQLYFCAIYVPPNSPIPVALLNHIIAYPKVIIMGDFNARHTDFRDRIVNANGNTLSNFIIGNNITRLQCPDPTFVGFHGVSTPDHILVSPTLLNQISNISIENSIASDHLPVVFSVHINATINFHYNPTIINDYSKADWTLFEESLSTVPYPAQPNSIDEIEQLNDFITDKIVQAATIAIPKKQTFIHRPQLPLRILNLIKEKRRIFRLYKATNNTDLKTLWNRTNARVRQEIAQLKDERWSQTITNLNFNDGASFWRKFKKISGQTTPSPSCIIHNRAEIFDPSEKANIFAQHLEQLFAPAQNPKFNDEFRTSIENQVRALMPSQEPPDEEQSRLIEDISTDEIELAINQGRNTAPGEDGITRKHLRHCPATTIEAMSKLFTACLRLSYTPIQWRTSKIVMVHKKGKPPENIQSYRPIALLPVMGKSYQRIITNRMLDFCDQRNIIPDYQFGFRRHLSTQDAILQLTSRIIRSLNRGHVTSALFIDLANAYDKVWTQGLYHKLFSHHFPFHFIRAIQSMLENRHGFVQIQNQKSLPFQCQSGLPQGAIFSPILFSIYTSDIPTPQNPNTHLITYADDIVLLAAGSNPTASKNFLQNITSQLEVWCINWRMDINTQKTKLILFRHRHKHKVIANHPHIRINLWQESLHPCNQVSYLGIILDDIMSLTTYNNSIREKILQRSNLLKMLRSKLGSCRTNTILKTYRAFIRPLILYASIPLIITSESRLAAVASRERAILRLILREPLCHRDELYDKAKMPDLNTTLAFIRGRQAIRLLMFAPNDLKATLTTFFPSPNRPIFKYIFPQAVLLSNTRYINHNLEIPPIHHQFHVPNYLQ